MAILAILNICGCSLSSNAPSPLLRKKHWKTEIPFEIEERGLLINTYWGRDSIRHQLLWDNNSPTWVNDDVIRDNKSIKKSKEYSYSTTTANGEKLSGDVFVCDRVSLGGINFENVIMYHFPTKKRGSIGEDIIRNGVWKINNRKNSLTFSSSIDSMGLGREAEIFPSIYSNTGFMIQVDFRENFQKTLQLDFGYNSGILLRPGDFERAIDKNKKYSADSIRFSTPGSSVKAKVKNIKDTFFVGDHKYSTLVTTNDRAEVNLIGYGFFSRFQYVILDYPNKKLYVIK